MGSSACEFQNHLCKASTALGSCPARCAAEREAFQAVPATGATNLPTGAKYSVRFCRVTLNKSMSPTTEALHSSESAGKSLFRFCNHCRASRGV